MTNTIIQWNFRGIKANHKELLLLLKRYNPKIVCLQEIFLIDINHLQIKNFQSYHYIHTDGQRASGGVSIHVRKDILQHQIYQQININSELQVIALKATLHKPINICCIYLPPHDPIHNQKLDKLIEQIPKPHILLGDFNSHNTVWGCQKTTKRAQIWKSLSMTITSAY